MANRAGGYPDLATGWATSVIDQDIVQDIIKDHERTTRGENENLYVKFSITEIAIIVNADTSIVIDGGAEIPLIEGVPYVNDIRIKSLAFKSVVGYKISYNY